MKIFRLSNKVEVSSLSCNACIRAEQHRVTSPSQLYKLSQPFTLIRSDVWGPSSITTSSGKRWFVTFIDDQTYFTWVFLFTENMTFQQFQTTIKTRFTAKIAFLVVIIVVSSLIILFMIFFLLKALSTKARVSISLDRIRWLKGTIVNSSRLTSCCLLRFHHTSGGMQFSLELILLIVCLNVSSNSRPLLNPLKSPTLPRGLFSMSLFRFFSALALSIVMTLNQTKFTPHAQRCVFVGYPLYQRGYKCFHLSS